ncbi:MAG: hypothetical protein AAF368_07295, partial [Planctomycetota bacterium]
MEESFAAETARIAALHRSELDRAVALKADELAAVHAAAVRDAAAAAAVEKESVVKEWRGELARSQAELKREAESQVAAARAEAAER